MDILENITKLRKEKNWSLYKLAEESGIPYSTFTNMFSRKTDPSITTIKIICDTFNISLSEFFAYNSQELNDIKNKELLYSISKLSKTEKLIVNNLINYMLKK